MADPEPFNSPVIVDATGRPASIGRREDKRCPECHAGPDARVRSGGFGAAHPVCRECGYEWLGERWTGDK